MLDAIRKTIGLISRISRKRIHACLEDRRGVVALEFALVTPLMVSILAGTYDISQVLITQQRMAAAATSIAEMITSMSAQPDGTNIISGDNVELAASAVFAYLPQWENGSASLYSVSISSIIMTASPTGCASSCTYTASTAWSASLGYGTASRRSCGTLPASPPAASDMSSLPAGLFGNSPLVSVDINYTYVPIFVGFFVPTMQIERSAFLPPRIGGSTQSVTYVPSGDIPAAPSSSAYGYAMCS